MDCQTWSTLTVVSDTLVTSVTGYLYFNKYNPDRGELPILILQKYSLFLSHIKIKLLWSVAVRGAPLAMVCSCLLQCVAHRLLMVSPKGKVGLRGMTRRLVLPWSLRPPTAKGVLLVLACLWLLRYFWNFTEIYFGQLSLKNNKNN